MGFDNPSAHLDYKHHGLLSTRTSVSIDFGRGIRNAGPSRLYYTSDDDGRPHPPLLQSAVAGVPRPRATILWTSPTLISQHQLQWPRSRFAKSRLSRSERSSANKTARTDHLHQWQQQQQQRLMPSSSFQAEGGTHANTKKRSGLPACCGFRRNHGSRPRQPSTQVPRKPRWPGRASPS